MFAVSRGKIDDLARELVRVRWERKCRAERLAEAELAAAIARARLVVLEALDADLVRELDALDPERRAQVDGTTGRWIGGGR